MVTRYYRHVQCVLLPIPLFLSTLAVRGVYHKYLGGVGHVSGGKKYRDSQKHQLKLTFFKNSENLAIDSKGFREYRHQHGNGTESRKQRVYPLQCLSRKGEGGLPEEFGLCRRFALERAERVDGTRLTRRVWWSVAGVWPADGRATAADSDLPYLGDFSDEPLGRKSHDKLNRYQHLANFPSSASIWTKVGSF
ncbi:hypothetical protein B0H13DRAFT_1863928 [Mycena leptocephala]|nr:hypothetical protein B0H13DRAFT_1863928 [Mycena leptocephala]